tara:strand:- start:76 stop:513 length:438 start_codon:yes stop_codon:yes gene_type:complete
MRIIVAFIAAVLVTYIIAVLGYTQLNLANLVEMGVGVSPSVRLEAALHDLVGMTGLYLPIISIALLLGFGFTRLVLIWLSELRTLGYIIGGFVAIFVVDQALGQLMGTHPLAVTRTTAGLLSQCLAGALGGYVFSLTSVKGDLQA